MLRPSASFRPLALGPWPPGSPSGPPFATPKPRQLAEREAIKSELAVYEVTAKSESEEQFRTCQEQEE